MKKKLLAIPVVFALAMLFSFTDRSSSQGEVTITVNADRPTKFDMLQNGAQSTRQEWGLTTPYKLTLTTSDAKFIFKCPQANSIKINVVKGATRLSADWPVTVVLIKDDSLTTFGF